MVPIFTCGLLRSYASAAKLRNRMLLWRCATRRLTVITEDYKRQYIHMCESDQSEYESLNRHITRRGPARATLVGKWIVQRRFSFQNCSLLSIYSPHQYSRVSRAMYSSVAYSLTNMVDSTDNDENEQSRGIFATADFLSGFRSFRTPEFQIPDSITVFSTLHITYIFMNTVFQLR